MFFDIIRDNNVFIESFTKESSPYVFPLLCNTGLAKRFVFDCNCNIIMYYDKSTSALRIIFSKEPDNRFAKFMLKEKLKNRRMCELCCNKSKCFRICGRCDKKQCVQCFKENNKQFINDCPFCRYNFRKHHMRSD